VRSEVFGRNDRGVLGELQPLPVTPSPEEVGVLAGLNADMRARIEADFGPRREETTEVPALDCTSAFAKAEVLSSEPRNVSSLSRLVRSRSGRYVMVSYFFGGNTGPLRSVDGKMSAGLTFGGGGWVLFARQATGWRVVKIALGPPV
jgi:hypothetical protein